jgi:hypothetical protein
MVSLLVLVGIEQIEDELENAEDLLQEALFSKDQLINIPERTVQDESRLQSAIQSATTRDAIVKGLKDKLKRRQGDLAPLLALSSPPSTSRVVLLVWLPPCISRLAALVKLVTHPPPRIALTLFSVLSASHNASVFPYFGPPTTMVFFVVSSFLPWTSTVNVVFLPTCSQLRFPQALGLRCSAPCCIVSSLADCIPARPSRYFSWQ